MMAVNILGTLVTRHVHVPHRGQGTPTSSRQAQRAETVN